MNSTVTGSTAAVDAGHRFNIVGGLYAPLRV